MEGYDPQSSFDERAAAVYDDLSRRDDTDETVELLAELAGDGPVLELAIGTGRVALPLAARGVRVDGVDFSPAMVAKLREKTGGDAIDVTIGDFADVPVDDDYALVYLVFNTIFNLLSQDDQVRCFENVASHLGDGGRFVVEARCPGHLYRLRDDQHVDAEVVDAGEVRLDVGRHDPARQLHHESHVVLSPSGVRLYPIVTRYIWPSEMDLMARIAGLELEDRWSGWRREAFEPGSESHVSVYRR